MKGRAAGSESPLFWTIAVAALAIALAGLVARGVDRAVVGYQSFKYSYAIVRVQAPEGPGGVALAQAALAHAPHVVSSAPMTARRAEELLNQMGAGPVTNLPPLGLIEIDIDPASAQSDVSGDIEAALAQAGVTARVIRPPSGPASSLAVQLRNAAWWAAGIFVAVMAFIISLAARSLAARRADLVTVMADLGATAGEAAGRVGDEAAILAVRAGIVGALVAAAAAVPVVLAFVPHASLRLLPHLLGPLDAAPLVFTPVIAALAAGVGARAGAESVHAQAARLA